jgi:PAS domain S-box-containing protein
MTNKNPETRLKELEIEMNDLARLELESSVHKELTFRQAIENAIPSGIAVVDNKGKQVYVNPSFCKMVGRDEYELLGKQPPYLYWAEQDMANINDAFQNTIQNKAPKEGFDLLFCHKSGKLIPVNVVISQFVMPEGGIYWLANILEITERKKIEEALKKSQLLLMSSVESQKSAIIFSIDRDYKYLYFNKAHADAMKFAYNAVINEGMNFLDFISRDDDGKLLKENIDNSFRGESRSIVQSFGDANIANYEVFFNPIVNEKNEIIGCTCLARNITERVKAEQALKESETKFREIINQINDAIIVFDEKGKIVIWNNGAEQLSGLKDNEILNKSIIEIQYQLTPPAQKDKTLIEKGINGILSFQTPERFNQIIDSDIIACDTRQLKNIQSTVFPIKLHDYHLFCTVIRDTTEIKRYEKELLRISEDKDKFYSIIAQYLYNPFNLFHNFTKMMAEELDTLSIREIQKMVGTMSKSATNLYSLLDNMLQYTRVNQGKITFKPQKANLNKISHEAVSILKPVTEEKNIRFNHVIADDIDAYADIFMLKTILRNLVANAIKYTPNDGQITISAHQTTSDVTISVLDNGTGLSPGYIKKLFDISQIHSALGEAEEKGTTLGLLLCKEFVEKHNGNIWVESEKGIGCRFKFTLPLFFENNDQTAINSQSL